MGCYSCIEADSRRYSESVKEVVEEYLHINLPDDSSIDVVESGLLYSRSLSFLRPQKENPSIFIRNNGQVEVRACRLLMTAKCTSLTLPVSLDSNKVQVVRAVLGAKVDPQFAQEHQKDIEGLKRAIEATDKCKEAVAILWSVTDVLLGSTK